MLITIWSTALILGFALLWKGGDYVIESASEMAKKWQLSPILVGMTLLAFGTSLPELVVNLMALSEGKDTLIFGNIIGSNISNTLLILGATALITPLTISRDIIYKKLMLNVLAVFILILSLYPRFNFWLETVELSRTNGLVLFVLFLLSLNAILKLSKSDESNVKESELLTKTSTLSISFILGLVGLLGGAKLVVESAEFLALTFGLSDALIALFMIALGTSLPELVTGLVAAFKRQSGLLIGNIIGSNVFNIFLILGACASISPISFDKTLNTDLYILLLTGLSLVGLSILPKPHYFTRYKGAILLILYIIYILFIFNRG